MNNLVKIHARPKLQSPVMVAAWPGISNVPLLVVTYLEKKLDFKPLATVEAAYFFEPIGVAVKNNVVEAPQFPQSKFYYRKSTGKENDIILFIGDGQPAVKGYELANCVIDTGLRFNVKRIYTCAAAITRINHTEQPEVWGAVSNQELTTELQKYNLMQKGNLQISGMNGLLLGVAKERNIEAICLLSEVPAYATRIQNPMAALAILKVLTGILDVELDTIELVEVADETRERMKQLAAEAMGEYIDLFTEPIWEQEEEEEE